MRWLLCSLLAGLLGALPAQAAEAPPRRLPADVSGVVVVATTPRAQEDPRLGRVAGHLSRRGLDAFAAVDMVRPPADPDRGLLHGRWRVDDARRLRRLKKTAAAAAAGDEAIRAIEKNAYAAPHLDLLIDALVERGATALELNDPATAETVFLKALAFNPLLEIDREIYGERMDQVFGEVRRASRELRLGSARIEVPEVPGAQVSVNFGSLQDAPAEVRLPDGRHYVSIIAPSRHEVVALVRLRAERESLVVLRPPIAGDVRDRIASLEIFRANDPRTVADMGRVAGTRFVLTASISGSGTTLALYDGRSGTRLPDGEAIVSVDPSPDELDQATLQLARAAATAEPRLLEPEAAPSWYDTWWGISLLGVAALGAGAAVLVLATDGNAEYVFGR